MRQVRKIIIVLVLAAGAFTACNQADRPPSQSLEKVTISFATPPYTVLVDIAAAKGYFRQQGLEVTPLFHSTGKAALEDVLAGKADFATVADPPAMFAILSGEKITIVATVQKSSKTNAIVARSDRGVKAPGDLKGKRIAVSKGTIAEYFLHSYLTTRGIAVTDVTVVNLKPEETPQALAKGVIDAASMFPPFQNDAQQMLGDNGITFYDRDIYTQTLNLVAAREYVKKNPEIVRSVLLALVKAEEFAANHPEEAQKEVTDFRQFDKKVLSAVWPDHTFAVTLDQALVLALEDESAWAIRHKLTGATKAPNYLDYIYLDGLKAVKPNAMNILR